MKIRDGAGVCCVGCPVRLAHQDFGASAMGTVLLVSFVDMRGSSTIIASMYAVTGLPVTSLTFWLRRTYPPSTPPR